ncbi:hypothetical protein H920_13822 [Fukomys damarensis]|uniref:Uncharacterized protein n=1 Tax=Fukomys damarensis TaxID=885580 RepID=A0A091DPT9_FUKDA|nr:hypothetical protein H920_13822 [Fukomys damarensis]
MAPSPTSVLLERPKQGDVNKRRLTASPGLTATRLFNYSFLASALRPTWEYINSSLSIAKAFDYDICTSERIEMLNCTPCYNEENLSSSFDIL